MTIAYADNMWFITMASAFLFAGAATMATSPPASGRLLKVPKVYNALITSDLPLIPSRAETAATAAVGPVLLYSSQLPVVLQPQAPASTQQQHLDKLQLAQNQLQREDEVRHQAQPQIEQQLSVQQLTRHQQLPVQQLARHQHLPVQQLTRHQQLPAQQLTAQQLSGRQLPLQQIAGEQLPAQHLSTRHRQQPHPAQQLPVQSLPSRHQQPPVQQLPVEQLYAQQLPTQQLTGRQQYELQQHNLPQQQQFSQVDYVRQQEVELQHQKQFQAQKQLQVQQQKQLQLFEDPQQDTSYLPMPEVNSYQPPPTVHIDEIKNNKPPNTAIPDVPPPPLPVGRRQQSYNLSPPPPPLPTNHHVPYG